MLFSLYLVNKDKICNVTNMIPFLIPSHNYGNFLKKCVKSIIKNNPKYIKEIIIVNDASSDNTDQIIKELKKENLPIDTPYMVEAHEKISISTKRKSCEQIFQRLMITYDGRVAMCCMDWGAQHCIGYIDKSAQNIDKTLKELKDKIQKNKSGFELLKNAKFPQKFNEPKFEIKKIKELWNGAEINKVRKIHHKAELNNIDICKKCDFKDTYLWREID